MCTRSAKENLLSTHGLITDLITRNNHLCFQKKKHQNTYNPLIVSSLYKTDANMYIIVILYIEKGQIMLRFLLMLLNL